MSKYTIGQAVKVVRCDDHRQHLVGLESWVNEVREMRPGVFLYGLAASPIERYKNAENHPDGWLIRIGWLGWSEYELEPIVPPGMESIEDANELYLPEFEEVPA